MDRLEPLRRPELHPYLTEQPVSSNETNAIQQQEDHRLHVSRGLIGHFLVDRTEWRLFVVLVSVSGVVLSAVSASAWYSYGSSQRRQAVTSSLQSVRSVLGTTLERDNDLVETVKVLIATHPQLTNRSLAAFLSGINPSRSYPGSIAFTYVENVSRTGLAKFEKVSDRDPPLGAAASHETPVKTSYNGRPGYCLTRLAFVDLLPSQAILEGLVAVVGGALRLGSLQLLRLVVRSSSRYLGKDRPLRRSV